MPSAMNPTLIQRSRSIPRDERAGSALHGEQQRLTEATMPEAGSELSWARPYHQSWKVNAEKAAMLAFVVVCFLAGFALPMCIVVALHHGVRW